MLLRGYDKGKTPSKKHQNRQVDIAKKRLEALEQRDNLDRKAQRSGRTPPA